jgi:hypothetical protein
VWRASTRARRAERYAGTPLGSEAGIHRDADGCAGGRRAAASQHGRERRDVTPARDGRGGDGWAGWPLVA